MASESPEPCYSVGSRVEVAARLNYAQSRIPVPLQVTPTTKEVVAAVLQIHIEQ